MNKLSGANCDYLSTHEMVESSRKIIILLPPQQAATVTFTIWKASLNYTSDNSLPQQARICADKYVAWIGTYLGNTKVLFPPFLYTVIPALAAVLFTTQGSFSRNICIAYHTLDDNVRSICKFCHGKALILPPYHRYNKQYLFEPCILLLSYSN